jgi:hypothetical protein
MACSRLAFWCPSTLRNFSRFGVRLISRFFGTMSTKMWHEGKFPQGRISAPHSSSRVSWSSCSVSLELPCWGTWQSPMPQSALQPSLKAFLPDSLLASSSGSKSHQWIWKHPWSYTTHCAIRVRSLVTDFVPPIILILCLAWVVFLFRLIHSMKDMLVPPSPWSYTLSRDYVIFLCYYFSIWV